MYVMVLLSHFIFMACVSFTIIIINKKIITRIERTNRIILGFLYFFKISAFAHPSSAPLGSGLKGYSVRVFTKLSEILIYGKFAGRRYSVDSKGIIRYYYC